MKQASFTPHTSFTDTTLSFYLASQGVSFTARTILKEASTDPHSLPLGKKVGGRWIWEQADVDRWVAARTRLDRTGDAAIFEIYQPVAGIDSIATTLGYFRRFRIGTVAEQPGISNRCVWKRVGQGKLPTPLKDGSATFWLAGELAEVLKNQATTCRDSNPRTSYQGASASSDWSGVQV